MMLNYLPKPRNGKIYGDLFMFIGSARRKKRGK